MDNKEKYELIVKLKELLIYGEKIDIEDNYINNLEISLFASKLLKIIYDNKQLNDYYKSNLNQYKEIENQKELFEKAIHAERNMIIEIYSKSIQSFLFHNREVSFAGLDDNISINVNYIRMVTGGIFHTLNTVYTEDDELGVFYRKLAFLYDYHYLANYENIYHLHNPNVPLFLYIACKKVNLDLLQYIYGLNLSEVEKLELEKQKALSEARNKLKTYGKKLAIFDRLYLNDDVNEIAKTLNIETSTVYNHISGNETSKGIVEILTGNKGSLTDLKVYLNKIK